MGTGWDLRLDMPFQLGTSGFVRDCFENTLVERLLDSVLDELAFARIPGADVHHALLRNGDKRCRGPKTGQLLVAAD